MKKILIWLKFVTVTKHSLSTRSICNILTIYAFVTKNDAILQ